VKVLRQIFSGVIGLQVRREARISFSKRKQDRRK